MSVIVWFGLLIFGGLALFCDHRLWDRSTWGERAIMSLVISPALLVLFFLLLSRLYYQWFPL
ncbi:MAG TPA: hypothetical protein VJB37_00040 [Patescibacteria group bacterium]|nr:hypothetical protein [Patescibacteria group bacterium]